MAYKIEISSQKLVDFSPERAKKLGRGATADVFLLTHDRKSYAVKIFKDINKFPLEKISSMITLRKNTDIFSDSKFASALAWPVGFVLKDGKKVGFYMPIFDPSSYLTCDCFFDPQVAPENTSEDQRALPNLTEILRNITKIISILHENGIHLVDLKPQNIVVSKRDFSVGFLDCDGFSILDVNNKRYPATLVSADYISPEILKDGLDPRNAGVSHDNYALSVLIFKFLNNGIHPFQGKIVNNTIPLGTNDDNAVLALYPYGEIEHRDIKPHPASVHETFPPKLVTLFEKSFKAPPSQRTNAKEWYSYFDGLIKNKKFKRCISKPSLSSHIAFVEGGCPACKRQSRAPAASQRPAQRPMARELPPKRPLSQPSKKPNVFLSTLLVAAAGWFVISQLSNQSEPVVQQNAPASTPDRLGTPTPRTTPTNPTPSTPSPTRPQSGIDFTLTSDEMHKLRLAIYRRMSMVAMPRQLATSSTRFSDLPTTEQDYFRRLALQGNFRLNTRDSYRAFASRLIASSTRPLRIPTSARTQLVQTFVDWAVHREADGGCLISTSATRIQPNDVSFVPQIRGYATPNADGSAMTWSLVFPVPFDTEKNMNAYVDGVRYPIIYWNGRLWPNRAAPGSNVISNGLTRAMQRGSEIVFWGNNSLTGDPLSISFSLIGFTAAFNHMMSICERPGLRIWIY